MSKSFDYHNYLKWDTAPTYLWEEPVSKMGEEYTRRCEDGYEEREAERLYHEWVERCNSQLRFREARVDKFNKRMDEFLDELEAGDDE